MASGWNVWVWLLGGGCGWKTIGVVMWVFSSYNLYIPTALVSALFCSSIPTSFFILLIYIIDSVDSISRDERDCH